MGKVISWFRVILGLKKKKKSDTPSSSSLSQSNSTDRSKEKRRATENLHKNHNIHNETSMTDFFHAPGAVTVQEKDANNHAIAVAKAKAAVAEAAVAASYAAAAAVRLTSNGRCTTEFQASAVKIQAVFRGYLARKALRALKGLVRLQALVRGHIERKRTADCLHKMQALMRAQARARAGRVLTMESSHSRNKSSHLYQPDPPTPENFERPLRTKGTNCERPSLLKRIGSKSAGRVNVDQDKPQSTLSSSDQTDEQLCDEGRTSTKSKSVDNEKFYKIRFLSKRKNLFHSPSHIAAASEQYSPSFTASKDTTTHQTVFGSSPCEVQSLRSIKPSIHNVDEDEFCTPENSPQFLAASSRGCCSRSVSSTSYLSEFFDHPNYMSYTESSKAKVRSLSAPKQRPQHERSSSTIHSFGELRFSSQRISALQAKFASKAYPGSCRLDRLGLPVGYKY